MKCEFIQPIVMMLSRQKGFEFFGASAILLSKSLIASLVVVFSFFSQAYASEQVSESSPRTGTLRYDVTFLPKKKAADVLVTLSGNHGLKSIDFNLSDSLCKSFQSENKLQRAESRLEWFPDSVSESHISYRCKIKHRRESKQPGKFYDAFINNDWVVVRGDDLVPPAAVRRKNRARLMTELHFVLPENWTSARTGWPLLDEENEEQRTSYRIDDDRRVFDRPTGWIIAGELGTRAEYLDTQFSEFGSEIRIEVSAAADSNFKRMDTLAFLTAAWPSVDKALRPVEKKLLVVGVGEPMWRGGLSAGNSFYVHEGRPLISENGTSTLLHELFHMLSSIRGAKDSDWIAEGLAEYYSIEFLARSGLTTNQRKQKTLDTLRDWSADVTSLLTDRSTGKTTAAAVLLFSRLDAEIKQETQGRHNLDSLAQALVERAREGERISLEILKKEFKELTKKTSSTLKSDLLADDARLD